MVELAYHIYEENVLHAMNLHIYIFSFMSFAREGAEGRTEAEF